MALDKTYVNNYRKFTIDTVPGSVDPEDEKEFMAIVLLFLGNNETYPTNTRPIKYPLSVLMDELINTGDTCDITLLENVEKSLPVVTITGMVFTKQHPTADVSVAFTT